jgi:TolA-binding protein
MKLSRLLVFGLMLTGLLQAQSEKVMIQELQRDVAQIGDNLRKYKESQDQRNADLESLLKQSLDANAKQTGNLTALQQSLMTTLAEQQSKSAQPINALGIKIDQVSQALVALQTSMDEMIRRQTRTDEKLTEILNNVKTLSAPPAAPPPTSTSGAGTAAATSPGASADVAFQAADRDLKGGRSQLAMDEFVSFIAQFPTATEKAAKAQYYIGVIYDRDEDYVNAVKAYDAVLERYPENPSTRDARYGKAVALMKLDRNVEAKKEFTAFLDKYSTDEKAAQVKQYLKDLNGPAHPLNNGKKRTKSN